MAIPVPLPIFFVEILYLHSQTESYLKFAGKNFLRSRSNLMADIIWKLRGEKCLKPLFVVVYH